MMGWDGTAVTPQIRNLIEEHHLGSILLATKNLRCKAPCETVTASGHGGWEDD